MANTFDNRVLSVIDLSRNHLGAKGAKHIAKAIKVSKCAAHHLDFDLTTMQTAAVPLHL
jgi:hypothetical protein